MLVGQIQYLAGLHGKKRVTETLAMAKEQNRFGEGCKNPRGCTTFMTQVRLNSAVIQMQGNHLMR